MTRCQTTAFAVIAACSLGATCSITAAAAAAAAPPPPPPMPDMVQTGTDIPKDWKQPQDNFDYIRIEVMIPMRDGVKLHTVIVTPKGANSLPMLLERTPYDATFLSNTDSSAHARRGLVGRPRLGQWHYILVWQDIRGKYGSQGDYVMTRPPMRAAQPDQDRRHHRRLGHDRLARQAYAGKRTATSA